MAQALDLLATFQVVGRLERELNLRGPSVFRGSA